MTAALYLPFEIAALFAIGAAFGLLNPLVSARARTFGALYLSLAWARWLCLAAGKLEVQE